MEQQILDSYQLWRTQAADPDLSAELENIAGQDAEIYERFYQELAFGTGGLRGIIGAGSNRMNIYTVRKATQGLADYIRAHVQTAAVAISYDSRHKSTAFAKAAAENLAANGIKVYIFPQLEPTPVLSFAVRTLGCRAGIMVTASHNPAQYNGYKCYGADGCQMTDADADEVTGYIRRVDIFRDVKVTPYAEALAAGMIVEIGDDLLEQYTARVLEQQVNPGVCREVPLRVVYTPLNGAGNLPVRETLRRIGVQHVAVVPEQELPDGDFPTAPYPNPEIREAFACALALAEREQPDLLLATDPDCDRVGIAVKAEGDYVLMSGNEVGCLLLEYILSCKTAAGTLPAQPVAVKTIVTTDLAARIAAKYGCEMRQVLTGFKYIGEQIGRLEQAGAPQRYILGFEESYGYLAGTYVRDKDAVVAAMLICEMAAYYKRQGRSLPEVYAALCEEHGYYQHLLVNATFEGSAGMKIMTGLMEQLRADRPAKIGGLAVVGFADYRESVEETYATGRKTTLDLPKSNVLTFRLEGDASVIFRPSGTEPKIKAYVTATGKSAAAAAALADTLADAARALLTPRGV